MNRSFNLINYRAAEHDTALELLGIALPEDAIDVTNNPAVATEVGDQFIFGAALFSPIRKYRTSESLANGQCFPNMGCAITIGPNDIKSDENYFVIPHLAWSKQLDSGRRGRRLQSGLPGYHLGQEGQRPFFLRSYRRAGGALVRGHRRGFICAIDRDLRSAFCGNGSAR